MKRRIFVRNAALGAFSLGIFTPGVLPFLGKAPSGAATQWLQQLALELNARRRSTARVAPESFTEVTYAATNYFAKKDYHSKSETFYFLGDQDSWCFYPVYLGLVASVGADMLVPVFHRDAANNWHLVKTLSGFQVEALARASQSLEGYTPAELQDLLMPVIAGKDQGLLGFCTRKGMVQLKTSILDGSTQTSCSIHSGSEELFRETFNSRHLRHA